MHFKDDTGDMHAKKYLTCEALSETSNFGPVFGPVFSGAVPSNTTN